MGWTAPRTWTTGELVTKTIMDTHVRDNLVYLKGQDGTVRIEANTQFGAVGNDYMAIGNTSAYIGHIAKYTDDVATCYLDLDIYGVNGQGHYMRMFRTSNTSGVVAIHVYKGNNTGTLNAIIGGNGVDSYVCADNGNFGVGDATPSYKLEVNGTFKTNNTSYLAWGGGTVHIGSNAGTEILNVYGNTYVSGDIYAGGSIGANTTTPKTILSAVEDGGEVGFKCDSTIDGTLVTLVAAGAVNFACSGIYTWYLDAANYGTGTLPGLKVSTSGTICGGNVTFAVAADGSITAQRTGGAGTYKIAFWLLFI